MNSYTGNRCDPLDPALCDRAILFSAITSYNT